MHAGTLAESAKAALAVLGKTDVLRAAYLVGGSSLALHLGHRKSLDLDFCTAENLQAEYVAMQLAKAGNFHTTLVQPPHTLLGEFNSVKFSLFRYNYPMLFPLKKYLNVSIASVADIAAMKLTAICSRATRRDYVDLCVIAQTHSFGTMLGWYEKKFGPLGNNRFVIVRALKYFADAEESTMPEMLIALTWEEVKAFLSKESDRLAKELLENPS